MTAATGTDELKIAQEVLSHAAAECNLAASKATSALTRTAARQLARYIRTIANDHKTGRLTESVIYGKTAHKWHLDCPTDAYRLIRPIQRSLFGHSPHYERLLSYMPHGDWIVERLPPGLSVRPPQVADAVAFIVAAAELKDLSPLVEEALGSHDHTTAIAAAQWLTEVLSARSDMKALSAASAMITSSDLCDAKHPEGHCCSAHQINSQLCTRALEYCSLVDPKSPICEFSLVDPLSVIDQKALDTDVIMIRHAPTQVVYPFAPGHDTPKRPAPKPYRPHEWFGTDSARSLKAHAENSFAGDVRHWCNTHSNSRFESASLTLPAQVRSDIDTLYSS